MILAVAAAWTFPHQNGTGRHADHAVRATGPSSGATAPPVLAWASSITTPGDAPQAKAAAPRVDCAVAHCVALTFDDGPGPDTARLLAILEKYDVRATFFLVGKMVERRPGVARRISEAGHEVGVHTWSHPDLRTLSTRQVRAQLTRTGRAITRTTGVRPTISRPPYGASSTMIRAEQKRAGLAEILWTVDPTDWKHRNARVVRRSVERDVRRNSIVLMHDIRPTTVDAIAPMLRHLQRRHLTLVTVSELLGETTPGVTYGRPDWSAKMWRELR